MTEITNGVEVPLTKWTDIPYADMRRIFTGPSQIRDVFIGEFGIEWVCSWLDPCDWRGSDRAIIPNHGLAANRIKQEAYRLLKRLNVKVHDTGYEPGVFRYSFEELTGRKEPPKEKRRGPA